MQPIALINIKLENDRALYRCLGHCLIGRYLQLLAEDLPRTFIMAMSSTHARKFQHLSGFLKQIDGVVCDLQQLPQAAEKKVLRLFDR